MNDNCQQLFFSIVLNSHNKPGSMKKAALLFTGVFLFTCSCHAQWVIQPGVGIAVPLTGYGSIVDPGLFFHMDFNKQLTDERFRLGIMLGWARMHSDDNGSDIFD